MILSSSATKPIAFRLRCWSSARAGRKINKQKQGGRLLLFYFIPREKEGRLPSSSLAHHPQSVPSHKYYRLPIIVSGIWLSSSLTQTRFHTKEKHLCPTNQFEETLEIILRHSAFSSSSKSTTRILQLEIFGCAFRLRG